MIITSSDVRNVAQTTLNANFSCYTTGSAVKLIKMACFDAMSLLTGLNLFRCSKDSNLSHVRRPMRNMIF